MQFDSKIPWEQFQSLFNAGEYYVAHEVLEEIWIDAGRPRPSILQALIQLCAALEQERRGNPQGRGQLEEKAVSTWRAVPLDPNHRVSMGRAADGEPPGSERLLRKAIETGHLDDESIRMIRSLFP
ncbi:MAG: DUF309 domain-containing protein [Leptospiraceae bacterium]|nr:DUF309 domain-containing protein [Leptospiraceae bacterium]MCB1305454.1 DUF309 domain-containing protein [Leptospiraceae bacterium]